MSTSNKLKGLCTLLALIAAPSFAAEKIDKIEVYDVPSVIEKALTPIFPEIIKLVDSLKTSKTYSEIKTKLISPDLFELKTLPQDTTESDNLIKTSAASKSIKLIVYALIYLFTVVIFIFGMIKAYDVLHMYHKDEKEGEKRGNIAFTEFIVAGLFFSLAIPSLDGAPIYFVALLSSILVGLEVANIVMLNTFSYANVEIDDPSISQIEYAKEVSSSKFKTEVMEAAQGRLLEDALLNTSMRLQQYEYKAGTPIASNEALIDVGERQQELEKLLGGKAISDKNCLLKPNWYQNGYANYNCSWLHQKDTDLGVMSSRLTLDKAKSFKPEWLPKEEQESAQNMMIAFDNAVSAYVEYQKSVLCPSVLGRRVAIDQLEMHVFCAKRESSGAIIKGSFYGYKPVDSHWHEVIKDVANLKFDWQPHLVAVDGIFEKRYRMELEKKIDPIRIYDSGILTLPYQFVSALKKYHSQQAKQSTDAAIAAVTSIEWLSRVVGDSYSHKPEALKGIKSKEELVRFLEKHFPFAVDAWFMNTFDEGALQAAPADEKKPSTFVAFLDYRDQATTQAVSLYGMGVTFDLLGLPLSKEIESWAKVAIYVAKFVHFSTIIALTWFQLMLVWQYCFKRLMIVTIAFPIRFLKSLFEDVLSLETSKTVDIISMKDLSLILINSFLFIVIGSVMWVSLFLATDFLIPFMEHTFKQTVIPVGGYSAFGEFVYAILMPLGSNLMVLFIMCMGSMRLFNYLSATLLDDAFKGLEENISVKQLASKLSLGGGLMK